MPVRNRRAPEVIEQELDMDEKNAPAPAATGNEREERRATSDTTGMVTAAGIDVNKIPQELKARDQWICYRQCTGKKGRPTKVPFNARTGEPASVRDPASWSSFETALQASGGYDGFGVALSADDPYTGIDLDGCVGPDGVIQPWAQRIIDRLDSYTEISPSGTGVHILIRGSLPPGRRRLNIGAEKQEGDKRPGVELYQDRRYLTFTGRHVPGTPETIEDRGAELESLHAELFCPADGQSLDEGGRGLPTERDDDILIEKAIAAANGEKFRRLWANGVGADDGTPSEADLALCSMLRFWTGADAERMDRLFRQSALYRDKWDEPHSADGRTYGEMTIQKTLDEGGPVYTGAVPGESSASEPRDREEVQEFVQALVERVKSDAGAPFEPEALEALATIRAHDQPGYMRVRQALKAAGVSLRELDKALPRPARTDRKSEGTARLVADLLPDAPNPQLVLPEGYFLRPDATGLAIETESGDPQFQAFAYAPVLITGRLRDNEQGTEALRLSWRRGNHWHETTVDRAVAMSGGRLGQLASEGFPVADENSRELAKYLHRMEALNYGRLPVARVSAHLGWQGRGGADGFLWGRSHILPSGEMTEPLDLDRVAPDLWLPDRIAFRCNSVGDKDVAAACHARGSFEEWHRAMAVVADFPKVLLALYAALVPMLLIILDVPNFIIDWACRTTTGKTTTLRLAASVWGNPNEHQPDSLVLSWDTTRVAVERTSAVLTGLPLILDDTKRAKRPEMVAEVLYCVAQGRGRGRGNIAGLAKVATWKTVLLSSGEAPATGFTRDGGTRTRTMEILGVPFGRQDRSLLPLISGLNAAVCANYGHAGPLCVQWLLKHRDRWDRFRDYYEEARSRFTERAPSTEGGRLAPYAAAIHVAARIAHRALELPWDYEDPLETLWEQIASGAADAAGEARALQRVMSWADANAATFRGREPLGAYADRQPHGGWSGRWDAGEDWKWIAFYPHVLERILREVGYEPEAILSGWMERSWLDHPKDRRDKQVWMEADGERKRIYMLVIRRSAIEEAGA
jgi:putative DNA primase/helicase